jgi:hypothetical protein
MLTKLIQKFGNGSQQCTFGVNNSHARLGTRSQPAGFTKNQVLATLLDPRTKSLNFFPDEEAKAVMLLQEYCLALALQQQHARVSSPTDKHKAKSSSKEVRKDAFDLFMEKTTQHTQSSVSANNEDTSETEVIRHRIEIEWSEFYKEALIDHRDNDQNLQDPLPWWRSRIAKYPLLSEVARRVLAIPATSAASERMFSTAGLTISKHRSNLNGTTAALLIWLRQAWDVVELMKAFKKGKVL